MNSLSEIRKNLNIVFKLTPFLNKSRKWSLINCLSFKTNKIQLIFENISNPTNVHACIRTAANFGINNIHYVQKYENLVINFLNEKSKVNSGLIKWMDVKMHNKLSECLDSISKEYEPLIITTDIADDSKNIMELSSLIQNLIPQYNEKDKKKAQSILEDLILYDYLKKGKINQLKEQYKFENEFKFDLFNENEKFIQNLYLGGKFLNGMRNTESKDKTLLIIFGNESRGVSSYAKRNSHHKIVIPHFGHHNTSYNLSVSVGMVLFYLHSTNFLPGSFLDFNQLKGTEMLAKYMISYFEKMPRDQIEALGLSDSFEDL